METKTDVSFGVVPVFKKDGVWQVLLVHQISYRGDDFWILPKGHAEPNETPTQTALRELAEETGITDVVLDDDFKVTISYSFVHQDVRIEKTVEYFLGYCRNKDVHISQPHEIKEIRWCTREEAGELLTHQNSKDVLAEVAAFINETSL
jgi:8-oxo-dGTP pyrophosphatase MutT (NUDIX family)